MHPRVAPTLISVLCLLPLLLAVPSVARANGAEDTVAVNPANPANPASLAISDPCKLVTPEEVQVVLGTAVASSAEVHVKDPIKFPIRICSFQGKNGKALNVSTGVKTAADFAAEWAGHDAITELGDAAFAVPPGVLVFQKGMATCKLQALNFGFARDGHGHGYPDPALAAKLKTLGLAAVARM
jgi:hypothetical protein